MPGIQDSYHQEALGRTTEDLIRRIVYTNSTCNEAGCQQCTAQREVLTARIHNDVAIASNGIDYSTHLRARQALGGATEDGTTQTAATGMERGLPVVEEQAIRRIEGEALDVIVQETNQAVETLRERIARGEFDNADLSGPYAGPSADAGNDVAAVAARAVEGADDPVQSTGSIPCECTSCVGDATPTTGRADDVPRSARRDDRRTAAAARLP